ncbi:MmyB family transcriptional regulator [Yinghuangia soli]|uniref:Helix-turn-helix domain-containing protein n=1 Tax=Yinghuangia soli TaxID=2908204 RepID=A0AA41PYC5_9ACTN|nr:helix-turn-helix domain-containing protein [Yinghuangia soli]MCF2527857.1 helix-turn-helix domain-containing protein [Yinghuangia soli]
MADRTELGAFLVSRRARLRPEDTGLPDYGGRRRVAGLRREEVAQLAGVSTAHYTRLEQGRGDSVSDEVLSAIGRALRLDADEAAYLRAIARRPAVCAEPPVSPEAGTAAEPGADPEAGRGAGPEARAGAEPRTGRETDPETDPEADPEARTGARTGAHPEPGAEPGLADVPDRWRHLLGSLVLTPALLIGRHTQIVAWNPLASAVFGDLDAYAPGRRTFTHLLFAAPDRHALFGAGWEQAAYAHVAHLRVLLGRFLGDRELAGHITEMRRSSPDFARMWGEHPVARLRDRTYVLHHASAGELVLHATLLALPDAPDCVGLDVFAAKPGSRTETALRGLGEAERMPAVRI